MNTTQTALIQLMLNACEKMTIQQWDLIKPHAEHEFRGLLMMLEWTNTMNRQREMTTEHARIHIDIHKNTMRTRLMSLPNITMIDAEHIINTAIDSIRKQLYDRMDWVII
jgi:ERCC4-type nuclease